jgi:ATP-dependent Lon protease
MIEKIIDGVHEEEGVRNLKRGLESIVGWINMLRYTSSADSEDFIKFPLTITESHVEKYLQKQNTFFNRDVMRSMYT